MLANTIEIITEPSLENESVDSLQLLIRGCAISQMIGTICEIGLPDALEPEESVPVATLSHRLKVGPEELWRLCRTLSGFGFFSVNTEGSIKHNRMSLLLRRDHEQSQYWAARFWSSPAVWRVWGELRRALRNTDDDLKRGYAGPLFAYLRENKELRKFTCDTWQPLTLDGMRPSRQRLI